MLDVTFGINNEGHPLAVSVAINGKMESFSPLHCFMPSQCQWVFSWIIGTAMPKLFGCDTLHRMQLFLTDGDQRMYNSFDEHQRTLYPNAKHGLCIYHLVTKGLECLKPKLLDMDTAEVQDLVHTFKTWVFSWMGLSGVESEDEFNLSKRMLDDWLWDTYESDDLPKAVRENAVTLGSFLWKNLLYHKPRWFFPDRKFHLSLNQKTTSKVETLNQTMKYKASKIVKPNMTMLQSLQSQDAQCKARMDAYKRSLMLDYQKTPLWANSPTVKKVSTICESQIHQCNIEASNYLCKPVSEIKISVVRKPNTAAAFCSECTSSKICEKCVATSPVPLFKRKRIIQFRATDEENLLEVVCSCPYYATYGIPCRHFVALLQVQPHHVHIRWHIDYAALFGRKGFENHLPLFEKRQFDARLKVTKAEKELMFINANKLWEESRSHSLEELFQAPLSQCFQKSATGIISHPLQEITSPELGMVTQSQESVAASGFVTEEFDPGSSGDISRLAWQLLYTLPET